MEEVKTPEVTEVPVKPVKEKDPVKELKKEIKDLNTQLIAALNERDEAKHLVEAKMMENERLQKQLDGLCAEFTRITNFIKDTLKVTHKSILMALKED